MNVFVTGGTGFVGANLVAGLNERGIVPRVLHRETSSLRALGGLQFASAIGDVLDPVARLAAVMADCEWVFHVAAVADYWRQGEAWLYKVNVDGTKRMLAAAQQAGVKRFVFTSSLAAMGVPERDDLLTESHGFNLPPHRFPYGHSKYLAELEVRSAVRQGLEAVIVNPAIVLGPRDVNEISGSIITEAARGNVNFILPGGSNFVAVADVVAGQLAAAERGRPGERYILGGENVPYDVVIPTICAIVGRKPPKLKLPGALMPFAAVGVDVARLVLGNRVPIDANQVRIARKFIYADTSKARQELDLPQTPFATMVEQAYAWYRENGFV
ncbi:MAG: NAD-dependent epimerase/dehydratase family protein [Anaerolineae bacterium]|nr:NAD-dependent epimerase/dehydratase family protein [Anaerolineae bacterium]